ncbi:MAG: ATP-binding protein [Candidatus Edwardsbacteria bacterium]|nr:ATP-binding protein [Candidatus Edwardsbacteria bacterium]
MIDEIQYLSNPSSFLKLFHDHHPAFKLIVTGSSSFDIKRKFKDSLAGRTVDFTLYPLDFQEFLIFKGRRFDLGAKNISAALGPELEALYREYALYGGYPKIVLTGSLEIKEKYLQQIIDTYVKKDIRDLGNIRDIDKFNSLLIVLSGQSGSLLNVAELSNTARLAKQTVEQYLFILENTYIIRLVRPYSGNLRSELFKTPKLYFLDSGLMQLLSGRRLPAVLGGAAFETAVFSDLTKQGGNDVFYWRTQDKKEIDFIVRRGRRLHPVEVKMNAASFSATAMDYFTNAYKPAPGACVRLSGTKSGGGRAIGFLHPWDLPARLGSR